MNELIIGCFAVSKAGHDFGKCYVIINAENEYVYLVDGRIRTLERPKKKKRKHMTMLTQTEVSLVDKVQNKTVKNEEIKRAIKLLINNRSGKEVE
ncbi:MAG: hypothetical protein K0S47_736 [Herbinix sp.]|jgi:ribosomal protein L14E/L6E/L27E|nr:hypothetical protein [Herbinix sp.]